MLLAAKTSRNAMSAFQGNPINIINKLARSTLAVMLVVLYYFIFPSTDEVLRTLGGCNSTLL